VPRVEICWGDYLLVPLPGSSALVCESVVDPLALPKVYDDQRAWLLLVGARPGTTTVRVWRRGVLEAPGRPGPGPEGEAAPAPHAALVVEVSAAEPGAPDPR
jgi:hypothetical protein